MTYPATNSKEASELLIDVSNQMHEIVNEDATTEVMTESGLVPSVRKALADTFLFQDPIAWNQGNDETAFNQLRTFNDNIYWAPTATTLNPIPMGATPIGDSNWKLAPVDVSREWTLQELTRSQNEVIGGKIFPLDDSVLQNGDDVPVGTTHLRVDIGGVSKLVLADTVVSGLVSNLTDWTATIGGTNVYFIPAASPNDPVSWGADPTGTIDSTAAFRRMSDALVPPIKHSGTFRIDDILTSPISVVDGFDMSGAKVICSAVDSETEGFNRSSYIFAIEQDYIDVTSDFTVSEFIKGATKLTNPQGYEGHLFFNSNTVQMLRNDNGNLSDVFRREPNVITKSGQLMFPMYLVFFTTGVSVSFKPFNENREYKFPDFEITGAIRSPVRTSRNNSKVTIGTIAQSQDNAIHTPHETRDANLVELTEYTRPKSGNLASPRIVGYPALHFNSCLITYDSITASDVSGWGGIDGNYSRGILVKDSHVTRVSGHAFCSDIKVVNSTIYDQAAIHGYGKYEVINNKISFRGEGFKALVQTREDYMSSWDGEIIIKNCEWDVIGSLDESRIVQCLPATYDGRPSGVTDFVAFEPTVQVDGITFDVKVPTPTSGYYTITGMYLGGSGVDNTHLDKKRLPDNICSIKNIGVNSSIDVKFNPITNGRSYAAVANVPALARHNKFDFIAENWTATRHYTPENYNDGSLFGLQTFQFSGASNIEQNYMVRNCDWVNVLYKTPDKCNVTFDGGKTLGVRAAGFINQPTVNVTTSLVIYKGGVNLVDPDTQVGGTPIKMPIAVESAIFRHGSYFTGVEPVSPKTMGGNKFNSQVVLMVADAAIVDKSSSVNEVTSNTLLDEATYGKSHSDYYEEQDTYTGTLTLTGGVTVDVVRGRIVSSTP